MKRLIIISLILGIVALLFFGIKALQHPTHSPESETTYTCSMHPQIQSPHPGDCPICGMDLIPAVSGHSTTPSEGVYFSPQDAQRIQLKTHVVQTAPLERELELQGRVAFDERSSWTLAAPFSGRLEWKKSIYPGKTVQAGQEVARLWSPEMANLLIDLKKSVTSQGENSPVVQSLKRQLQSRYGLDTTHWQKLDANQGISIVMPRSGIVVEKQKQPGDYVNTGNPILKLEGNKTLWGILDIYENDLMWAKPGQRVRLKTPSLNGVEWESTIESIDAMIDPNRGVAQARVLLQPNAQLKAGATLRATLKASLESEKPVVVIPSTAVLWTGTRSMVWVRNTEHEGYAFQIRPVTLGPFLGDRYAILDGLQPEEEVAIQGVFAIDASAQLTGNPSMLNAPKHHNDHTPPSQSPSLPADSSLSLYLALKDALTKSDSVQGALILQKLYPSHTIHHTLDSQRAQLKALFQPAQEWAKKSKTPVYIQYCPMAFHNQGAHWLSLDSVIRNPYFGDKMLTCGEIQGKTGSLSL